MKKFNTHDIHQWSIMSSNLKYPVHPELKSTFYKISDADPKQRKNTLKKSSRRTQNLTLIYKLTLMATRKLLVLSTFSSKKVCYNYICDDGKDISTTYLGKKSISLQILELTTIPILMVFCKTVLIQF